MPEADPDKHPQAVLPAAQSTHLDDKIISAREAALWLDVNPRTAQLRAGRALRSGERTVRTIAGAYCAPGWWWQKVLAKPIRPGRPRQKDVR